MLNIKPISSLKNYQSIVDEVRENAPVYLTKNGTGCCALVDITYVDDYERMKTELDLLSELYKGKKSGEIEGWISLAEIKEEFHLK